LFALYRFAKLIKPKYKNYGISKISVENSTGIENRVSSALYQNYQRKKSEILNTGQKLKPPEWDKTERKEKPLQ